MKKITFKWFGGFLLPFFLVPLIPSFAQCLPSIGNAASFSIFTSSGNLDDVASSTIEGSIGTNLGTIAGFNSSYVSGQMHIADASTNSASTDLGMAYAAFQNMAPTVTTHLPAFGSGETLFSGIYSIGAAGSVAGTLLLDAQNDPSAKFVFKFGGAFTSGAGSTIVLINGASTNNIYWIVEGAFSLAANCTFKGTIISNGAISIGVNNILNSKLLSVSGAISTYGTQLSIEGINNTNTLYYTDIDLDGFGDATTETCDYTVGLVTNASDCNDADETVHPGAIEVYGNGIDDNCNGTTDTDTSVCDGSTTWDGSSWSNGLPSYAKEVIFGSNFTTSTTLYACKIHTQNNAVVIANHDVFVYGSITVDTGSSYTQMNDTNLIQMDPLAENVGPILVHRNTSNLVRLDHTLWGSPVENQNIYAFSPQTLTHRFYTYQTSTDTYLSSTLSNSSTFETAKGYVVRAPNNQSASVPAEWAGNFYGVPNNGTLSFNVAYSPTYNFNLVGNPYPSTMDATDFVLANSDTIEGTLYFYAHTLSMDANGLFQSGTNYATWNATGATSATEIEVTDPAYHTPAETPDGSIQVGQGFFVKAKSGGAIQFTNALRTNNQAHQFFRTLVEKNRIWLNLGLGTTTQINQIMIGYVTGATQNDDSQFDGVSYGNSGSYLYSIIGSKNFVIQGRALPFSPNDKVLLGFDCQVAGTYSITLHHFDGLFANNQTVYIRDNQTGITSNISIAPYYFWSNEGIYNNRFEVVYLPNLGVYDPIADANSIRIFTENKKLVLETHKGAFQKILVYDCLGRLLMSDLEVRLDRVELTQLEPTHQMLLVKIYTENEQWITIKTMY